MRALHLCAHELRRATRSLFLVGIALVAPLGISALIALSMRGAGDDSAHRAVRVVVHAAHADDRVPRALTADALRGLVDARAVATAEAARAEVRAERADVAVIVDDDGRTTVLHDPALRVAQLVVAGLVAQLRDAERGAAIAIEVVAARHPERAVTAVAPTVGAAYGAFLTERHARATGTMWPGLVVEDPRGAASGDRPGFLAALAALILAAQIVVFAFFGGGFAAESIVRDIEEGTFPRLRTFPLSLFTLLLGKALYIFVLVSLQVTTLLLAGALLFDVEWGDPLRIALAALGVITLASGFGLFVVSFARSRKQAGALLGGVMTVLGGAGGLFTVGVQNMPPIADTIARFTPHGLAMHGLREALRDAPVVEIAANTALCAAVGVAAFALGLLRFARRTR